MTKADRPPIPDPVKREVRQRCGFGCVICGLPLYEYDHMVDYAEVQEHSAANITLLCDRHHREKTAGLLTMASVQRANAEPHNVQNQTSSPLALNFEGDSCWVDLGGNLFGTPYAGAGTQVIPVSVDDIPLVRFILLGGQLLLTIQVFDECNRLVLKVWDNELVYCPDPWDIEFVGRRLILREAARKILLDMVFDPPNRVTISRGRLLCNGVEILIRPDLVLIPGDPTFSVSGSIKASMGGGIVIGPHPVPIGSLVRIEHASRYLKGRREAEEWKEEVFGVGGA